MSGPKCSHVEPPLNRAVLAASSAIARVAGVDESTINSLTAELNKAVQLAQQAAQELSAAGSSASPSAKAADDLSGLRQAEAVADKAIANAKSLDKTTAAAIKDARTKIDIALRRGRGSWADQEALNAFNDAKALALQAQDASKTAISELKTAIAQAGACASLSRQHAKALSEIAALKSLVNAIDPDLIKDWAADGDAFDKAVKALEKAENNLESDDYDSAATGATAAADALQVALDSAIDNNEANDRRASIGGAIMEALAEMHFDVSFQAGTRDEPLRISGQTADENGKGDFDLDVPLSGDVDFEVTADSGDNSCVQTIESLTKKLEERGVTWKTTDWGQAEKAAANSRIDVHQEQRTQQHTNQRTRT